METTNTRYAVVDRPGSFTRSNQATVWSTHATLQAAKRAAKGHPTMCVVQTSAAKGDAIWGDMYPVIVG